MINGFPAIIPAEVAKKQEGCLLLIQKLNLPSCGDAQCSNAWRIRNRNAHIYADIGVDFFFD